MININTAFKMSITIIMIHKNSQAVKNGVALKSLGEKSCKTKGGGQEMAAMMLMLINFNNAHSHY